MSDLYHRVSNAPVGGRLVGALGLPRPTPLERHEPGRPPVSAPVLIGEAQGGRLGAGVALVLDSIGATAVTEPGDPDEDGAERFAGLIFDATGIAGAGRLRALYEFFNPVVRRLAPCGRLIVLGTPPEECDDPAEAVAQRALEGFTRSMGKEVGHGSTAQLVYVSHAATGAEGDAAATLESTLRFLLSARSAYVSGQVVRLGETNPDDLVAPRSWERPLEERIAVVTGASRGIGEAIATTLARDGATVVCLDVPQAGEALSEVANSIGGAAVQLDITDPAAPARLASYVDERHDGLDVLVHNAGVTRDKTLARMNDEQWDGLMDMNLVAPERLTGELVERDLLRSGARVVCVSSVSGIAGNRGQSNYATSKAGLIGLVQALAPAMRDRHATINAVAPGFIETSMTEAMPLATREGGRRLNSLAQGGLPVDVAETIAWMASPGSAAVNGNVVRVCGQSLLGA